MLQFSLDKFTADQCNCPDLLILNCSFESRSISLLKRLNSENLSIVVFYNKESLNLFNDNFSYINSNIKNCTLVEMSIDDPLFTVDQMIATFKNIANRNYKNILLDITCFTHETLLIILQVIRNYLHNSNIACAYVNALDYSIGDIGTDKWLSRGISEIRPILGYAGNIEPAKKTHLIMIVGYEIDRAYAIINELEPNSIAIGYGKAEHSTTEKNKSSNELYSNLLLNASALYYNISSFEIRCTDPIATADAILLQASMHKDKNLIVVPLNNKLSTLGVALAHYKNDNLQVCYAKALEYNIQNYSIPGNKVYLLSLKKLFS